MSVSLSGFAVLLRIMDAESAETLKSAQLLPYWYHHGCYGWVFNRPKVMEVVMLKTHRVKN